MRRIFLQPLVQSIKNCHPTQVIGRSLWGYVAIAFNKVDNDRLQKVGPDRLCAEWVLKNGGGVRLDGMPNKLIRDYNSLPPESSQLRVKVVDGSDSSLMKIGLEHFKNCTKIDKVIFHNCKHLENDGLGGLLYVAKSLKELQVSGCYNISDADLTVIGDLKALQKLTLFDLKYVKDLPAVKTQLQQQLPQCQIDVKE